MWLCRWACHKRNSGAVHFDWHMDAMSLHSEHIVSVLGHMDPNVQGMLTVLILLDTHLPT